MSLYALFSSAARVQVLELLLNNASQRFYQREISQRATLPIQAVQRELTKLTQIGLVTKTTEGNRAYYQINKDYYIFKELKNIFLKSSGIGEALQKAFNKQKEITVAFIFGSVARGTEKSESDIDLLVLGDISARKLNELVFTVAEKMGREINQHLYSPTDFIKKIKSGNHFAVQITKGPKLFLIGNHNEFKQFIKIGTIKTA